MVAARYSGGRREREEWSRERGIERENKRRESWDGVWGLYWLPVKNETQGKEIEVGLVSRQKRGKAKGRCHIKLVGSWPLPFFF